MTTPEGSTLGPSVSPVPPTVPNAATATGIQASRSKVWFGSAFHALSAALSQAPENAAYGLMALAPLGLAFGPAAMALALLGVVVANAVASLLGGGRLVSGPRASLALLTAALAAALIVQLGVKPGDDPWRVLVLMALAVAGAGALQACYGLARLGAIVKFTPYPVRLGLGSGIGLLLVASALPVVLGQGFGRGWVDWTWQPRPATWAVGLTAWAVTTAATRARSRVPPLLLGLASAAALHAVLAHTPWAGSLGHLVGTPSLPPASWPGTGGLNQLWQDLRHGPVLALLASFALTVSVLGSLDTLLTTSIVDGRLRSTRSPNHELIAQGLANIAVAFGGGQATSPSVPRSLALVLPQPGQRHAVLVYAATTAGVLLLVPGLLGWLPDSAIGGVLLSQGLQMVSSSLWRTPLELLQRGGHSKPGAGYDDSQRRMLAANWAVSLLVALNALLLGLGPAVLIGATFAVLLFVRANMRDVVRRSWTGENRRSLKTRPAEVSDVLRREGHRLALLELEGSLFFGTADALRLSLMELAERVDIAILDLHQITDIDVTAARILVETAEDWSRGQQRLIFAEWGADDARRRVLEAVAGSVGRAHLHFANHTDAALEAAEDLMLARLAWSGAGSAALRLEQTLIARGLDATELALLAEQAEAVHFERGAVLFRQGDPGDALYISLQGEIGLRLPQTNRRLACFAAGVCIGEMAVLAHTTRSAEAFAESPVRALRLSVEAFDRIRTEHPALAAKLLANLALHLANRVRILTGDLGHWVTRATVRGATMASLTGQGAGQEEPEA